MNTFRDTYSLAQAHALALEIDGDILNSFGCCNMRAYTIECRDLLKNKYNIIPYPFEIDDYWTT